MLEHAKKTIEFQTPEALIAFIQKSHDEYLERKKGVEEDIKSIVVMNEQAVHSITEFFRQAKQKRKNLFGFCVFFIAFFTGKGYYYSISGGKW